MLVYDIHKYELIIHTHESYHIISGVLLLLVMHGYCGTVSVIREHKDVFLNRTLVTSPRPTISNVLHIDWEYSHTMYSTLCIHVSLMLVAHCTSIIIINSTRKKETSIYRTKRATHSRGCVLCIFTTLFLSSSLMILFHHSFGQSIAGVVLDTHVVLV